jgi:very-short-patch-repair endonuclease
MAITGLAGLQDEELFAKIVAKVAMLDMEALDVQSAAKLVRAFSLGRCGRPPKALRKHFARLADDVTEAKSGDERFLKQDLSGIAAAVGTKFNVFHPTGIEMDVWNADLLLNIELDGTSHSRCRRENRRRDAFLEELGIHVRRIDTVGKKRKEICEEAVSILNEVRESRTRLRKRTLKVVQDVLQKAGGKMSWKELVGAAAVAMGFDVTDAAEDDRKRRKMTAADDSLEIEDDIMAVIPDEYLSDADAFVRLPK